MLDTATYTPRLKALFRDQIKPAMKEEFGYSNDMQIPRLEKIVLNIGCGAESGARLQEGQRRPSRT
jgi:large subunit ribosomal protein L5